MKSLSAVLILGTLCVPSLRAEEPPSCPLHAAHAAAQARESNDLDRRGDEVMGFEHTRTTHHFRLEPDGGVIQVETNDPADAGNRQAIRTHLEEIAGLFSRGDFSAPFAIHQREMPGVPVMTRKKDAIQYRYEEIARGGRVRIITADPEAVAAVHEFLKAQIADHRTGDHAGHSK